MAHYDIPIRLWMYVDRTPAIADNFKHKDWGSSFFRERTFQTLFVQLMVHFARDGILNPKDDRIYGVQPADPRSSSSPSLGT